MMVSSEIHIHYIMAFNNTTSAFWHNIVPSYRSWSPRKDKEESTILALIVLCIAMINALIFLTLFCYRMHNIGRRRQRLQKTTSHLRTQLLNKLHTIDATET